MAAGLFYCLSHALFKGTLFMCAGAVQHATGTRDLRQLGGLAAAMPCTTLIWIVAAAAISGVPLTNGFVAKWLLFNAALADGALMVVLVGWVASLLTAFSFLKATVSAFYGSPSPQLVGRIIREAPAGMLGGMGAMGALCVVFGLAPQVLMLPVVAPAVRSLGFNWDIGMSWLGMLTTQGGIGVTFGAAAVVASVALGLLVYRLAQAPAAAPVSVFSGGEAVQAGDRPGAVDFAVLAEAAFHPVYALDPDPLWLAIWGALAAAPPAPRRSRAAPWSAARRPRSPSPPSRPCLARGCPDGNRADPPLSSAWRSAWGSTPGPSRRAAVPGGARPRRSSCWCWQAASPRRPGLAVLLDDLAELAAVGLVASTGTTEARAAARLYLLAIVPAILLTHLAHLLIDAGADAPSLAVAGRAGARLRAAARAGAGVFLAAGGGARLPGDDDGAGHRRGRRRPASATCWRCAPNAPWVFENYHGVWIALAVASMLGGALLALAQTELKPMLAFSSIDDIGYLLLGLVLGGPAGTAGAWFGILSHGIAKVVLFGAVGAAEWYLGPPGDARHARAWPRACRSPAPPSCWARWASSACRRPSASSATGGSTSPAPSLAGRVLVAAMCAATAMALLCYARAIHRTWLGPTDLAANGKRLPASGAAVLLAFALAAVLLGLVPGSRADGRGSAPCPGDAGNGAAR